MLPLLISNFLDGNESMAVGHRSRSNNCFMLTGVYPDFLFTRNVFASYYVWYAVYYHPDTNFHRCINRRHFLLVLKTRRMYLYVSFNFEV